MTLNELCEANGLVARFYHTRSLDEKWRLQLRLLELGVKLNNPVPDPHAPLGGTALRVA